MKFKILSTNISEKKGTVKLPINEITLDHKGVVGDAHAGHWHRQVSLLGIESFEKFNTNSNRKVEFGEFGENITTEGLLLYKTAPLDRFICGEVELEVTQIGKHCHGSGCAIFVEVGNCVMPKEGIFCRVIKPGSIKNGDVFEYHPYIYKALVITLSDRASQGIYPDKSGPEIESMMLDWAESKSLHFEIERIVIGDDADLLKKHLEYAKDKYDFIITTGGTGIGPRDITVDIAQKMLDKEIPGIMEHIRVKYGSEKPNALLSRGVAGIMGKAQVYTLPGSVKAVKEYMTEIQKTMFHLVLMMYGIDSH